MSWETEGLVKRAQMGWDREDCFSDQAKMYYDTLVQVGEGENRNSPRGFAHIRGVRQSNKLWGAKHPENRQCCGAWRAAIRETKGCRKQKAWVVEKSSYVSTERDTGDCDGTMWSSTKAQQRG